MARLSLPKARTHEFGAVCLGRSPSFKSASMQASCLCSLPRFKTSAHPCKLRSLCKLLAALLLLQHLTTSCFAPKSNTHA